MTKKISLYFDPYVWESLHRVISLLLVSGKPPNDLPNMNDFLESAIIYVSRSIERKPEELLSLSKYTEGMPVNRSGNKNPPIGRSDKGRMAFRTSTRVIDALRKIRESKATVENSDESPLIKNSVSDAILTRSCVYYLIESPSLLDFFLNLYLSTLFDLKANPLSFRDLDLETDIEWLNNEEKEKIRMILWDQSIISFLIDPSLHSEPRYAYFNEKAIRKQGSEPDPFYQSRAFNFNYLTAIIGWLIVSHFDILEATIPEIITNFSHIFKKDKDEDEEDSYLTEVISDIIFLEGLEAILKLSVRINQDIHKQKSNLNRRTSDMNREDDK